MCTVIGLAITATLGSWPQPVPHNEFRPFESCYSWCVRVKLAAMLTLALGCQHQLFPLRQAYIFLSKACRGWLA